MNKVKVNYITYKYKFFFQMDWFGKDNNPRDDAALDWRVIATDANWRYAMSFGEQDSLN